MPSEWCKKHCEDYNILTGCQECKDDSEPMFPLDVRSIPGVGKAIEDAVQAANGGSKELKEELYFARMAFVDAAGVLTQIVGRGFLTRGDVKVIRTILEKYRTLFVAASAAQLG